MLRTQSVITPGTVQTLTALERTGTFAGDTYNATTRDHLAPRLAVGEDHRDPQPACGGVQGRVVGRRHEGSGKPPPIRKR